MQKMTYSRSLKRNYDRVNDTLRKPNGFSGSNFSPINLPTGGIYIAQSLSPKLIFDSVCAYIKNCDNTLLEICKEYPAVLKSELSALTKLNKDKPKAELKEIATKSAKRIIATKYIPTVFDVGTLDSPFKEFTKEQKEAFVDGIATPRTETAFNYLVDELNLEITSPEAQEIKIIMTENATNDVNQIKNFIAPIIEKKVNGEFNPTSNIASINTATKNALINKQINNYSNYVVNNSGQNTSLVDTALKTLELRKSQEHSQMTK